MNCKSIPGGTANNTKVNYDGRLYVFSDGTATNTTVNYFGNLIIDSDGIADNISVKSKDRISVSRVGNANNISVEESGYLYVFRGGTATNIVWTPCEGRVYVRDGEYATFVSQYSRVYYGSNNQLLSNTSAMDSMMFNSSCEINVMSDGTVTNTFKRLHRKLNLQPP